MINRPSAQVAGFGLLVFLLLASCLVAGVAATLFAWLAWLLLSLPGLALFGSRGASLAQLALASVAGIAVSLLASIILGLLVGKLPLLILVAIPVAIALTIHLLQHPGRNSSGLALPATAWEIAAPLFALLLSFLPLYLVGAEFDGGHHFRSFFNADFFKHIANSEELARGTLPPLNPFAADQELRYYWAFYLLPATVIRLSGFAVSGVDALLAVVMLQNCALGLLAFGLCIRLTQGRVIPAAAASILTLLSLSLDGLASLMDWGLIRRVGLTMATVNQEALDFTQHWHSSSHLAGSTWQRLCLYLPQHELALLLFLTWASLFVSANSGRAGAFPWPRAVLLLPLPMISFYVGILAATAITLAESIRVRRLQHTITWGLLLGVSILLLLPTGILSTSPSDHASDPFLSLGNELSAPLAERVAWMAPQFITTFGVVFLLGLAGIGVTSKLKEQGFPLATLPLVTVAVGVFSYFGAELLIDGRLRVEAELKTSFILLAGLMMGSALFLAHPPSFAGAWRLFRAVCIPLLLAGLVSPLHDLVWHSSFPRDDDVAVTDADMEALRWIRKNTAADAVFLQPLERPFLLGGRDAWVAIFGARRVAVAERAGAVSPTLRHSADLVFDTAADREIRDRALRELQVDYIYLSRSLLQRKFDQLAKILLAEGRDISYRSADVAIVKHQRSTPAAD